MTTAKKLCGFESCDLNVVCKGLCNGHYTQQYKGQELRPLNKRRPPTACVADECTRRARMFHSGQALCSTHHQRWLKYGDANKMTRGVVVERGMAAITYAVANWDRAACWLDWANLPCWEGLNGWGGRTTNDYPHLGGVRVMWLSMEADGRPRPAAPDNYGLHDCDTPACWNPDHLRWGSHIENMQDTAGKMNYCRHCDHCNP